MMTQPVLLFVAAALFVIGIAGNGFEMRKIRMATEGQPNPKNVFLDRRNFKWYALMGISLILLEIDDIYT